MNERRNVEAHFTNFLALLRRLIARKEVLYEDKLKHRHSKRPVQALFEALSDLDEACLVALDPDII